jgi:ubiquinone/menaquinone biosynthesis C-methylase UbiE
MGFWLSGRARIAEAMGLDLTHSQIRYARALDQAVSSGARWMELGCGRQILPDWALAPDQQAALARRAGFFVGVDVDGALLEHPLLGARVIGLGGHLPFADASFDLLTANMVVEHIPEPEEFLRDIRRVLKPGGRFLFHTPNYVYYLIFLASFVPDAVKKPIIRVLEHRKAEDVFPTHYQMNTREQVESVARRCGFEVERLDVVGSSGSFGLLGPLGWLECGVLKALDAVGGGRWNSNLICVLRRPE